MRKIIAIHQSERQPSGIYLYPLLQIVPLRLASLPGVFLGQIQIN